MHTSTQKTSMGYKKALRALLKQEVVLCHILLVYSCLSPSHKTSKKDATASKLHNKSLNHLAKTKTVCTHRASCVLILLAPLHKNSLTTAAVWSKSVVSRCLCLCVCWLVKARTHLSWGRVANRWFVLTAKLGRELDSAKRHREGEG